MDREFGLLLRRYRKAAGLSIESLAEGAGLSARAVKYQEDGDHLPYKYSLNQLMDALQLTASQREALLLAWERDQQRDRPQRRSADAPIAQAWADSPPEQVSTDASAETQSGHGAGGNLLPRPDPVYSWPSPVHTEPEPERALLDLTKPVPWSPPPVPAVWNAGRAATSDAVPPATTPQRRSDADKRLARVAAASYVLCYGGLTLWLVRIFAVPLTAALFVCVFLAMPWCCVCTRAWMCARALWAFVTPVTKPQVSKAPPLKPALEVVVYLVSSGALAVGLVKSFDVPVAMALFDCWILALPVSAVVLGLSAVIATSREAQIYLLSCAATGVGLVTVVDVPVVTALCVCWLVALPVYGVALPVSTAIATSVKSRYEGTV